MLTAGHARWPRVPTARLQGQGRRVLDGPAPRRSLRADGLRAGAPPSPHPPTQALARRRAARSAAHAVPCARGPPPPPRPSARATQPVHPAEACRVAAAGLHQLLRAWLRGARDVLMLLDARHMEWRDVVHGQAHAAVHDTARVQPGLGPR
eukprot:155188-Prymnesium_polylepis.1